MKTILYYTDNTLDDTKLGDAVRDNLLSHNIPIVSVSLKPIDFGYNLVYDGGRCSESLLRQTIIGLSYIQNGTVYMCEHDCLYPPCHFELDDHPETSMYDGSCYRLWKRFAYQNNSSKWVRHLSMAFGNRDTLLEGMQLLLEDHLHNGKTLIYEPGFGESTKHLKTKLVFGRFPILDVRYGGNFTSSLHVKSTRYMRVPYWGKVITIRKQLGL